MWVIKPLPPPQASTSTYPWRSPAVIHWRKRSRRRGKRAGTLDFLYFCSPQTTGWAVAYVFESSVQYQLSSLASFSGFELQTCILIVGEPILCAPVYHRPKFNKDFMRDLTDFGRINSELWLDLIVMDINIHVQSLSQRPFELHWLF